MRIDFKKIFKETPEFLKILGFKNAYFKEQENIWVLEFMPSKALTHSNGTIIQGGFVSGMLDASMSQFIMYKSNGKNIPLTLDLNINFLQSCKPNILTIAESKIIREGNSIIFTTCELYQDNVLIAHASATNKIIKL
tara:strand:+ start:45 stop:455 length:411 start_codon:yes stop_codon:yes gene_type:complete